MKKTVLLLILAAAAFAAMPAAAQISSNTSYAGTTTIIKKADTNPWTKWLWYVDASLRVPTAGTFTNQYENKYGEAETDNIKFKTGFGADFGFQRRMGRKGWYWGMSLGFFYGGTDTSRDHSEPFGGLRFVPVNFGWRKMLSKSAMLDINAGLGFETHFNDGYNYGYEPNTGSMIFPISVGVQVSKLRVNLKYQVQDFRLDYEHYPGEWHESKIAGMLMLSVGYAFQNPLRKIKTNE